MRDRGSILRSTHLFPSGETRIGEMPFHSRAEDNHNRAYTSNRCREIDQTCNALDIARVRVWPGREIPPSYTENLRQSGTSSGAAHRRQLQHFPRRNCTLHIASTEHLRTCIHSPKNSAVLPSNYCPQCRVFYSLGSFNGPTEGLRKLSSHSWRSSTRPGRNLAGRAFVPRASLLFFLRAQERGA